MELYQSLNPLNQVYVFNKVRISGYLPIGFYCLNPLNQVYVFNRYTVRGPYGHTCPVVLIP